MSMRDEIKIITADNEKANKPTTAESVVEAARNKERFPLLNAHFWAVAEADLAMEARIFRAHRLLISVRIVTEEGDNTRQLTHIRGTAGYRSTEYVSKNVDLALAKLNQLGADIARARARLREFRAFIPDDVSSRIDASLEAAETATVAAATQREAAA